MNLSFFTPARTVLMVSDEALYIYGTSARGARLVETVPWEAENFAENVSGILTRDCGGKPVLILNDMVEQHYRKERVLRAGGALDRANILKRKLAATFPSYPIRAAFPLKEKPPKTDKRGASDIYIFAAVPGAGQFNQAIEAVRRSYASLAGFYLLPVESSDMVSALSAKLGKGRKERTKWTVCIGQHRHGGLRQIVTKNGELALTRMTPVTDNIQNAEGWSRDVHQEFRATMSYLSRFGYQAEDGLDIVLIADSTLGDVLGGMIEEEGSFHALTPHDAANILGVSLGKQVDAHYADPLHAVWAGRKSRFILPMRAPQIEQVSRPRRNAVAASLILLLTGAFLGFQFLGHLQGIAASSNRLGDMQKELAQLDVQYQKEVQRKEALGFDVRLVQSSIAVHENLEQNRVETLRLFQNIGTALGRDMRLDLVRVETPDAAVTESPLRQTLMQARFEALLQMTYPGTTDIDKGNREVSQLRDRLQVLLPGHEIQVTKFLKDYEYVEELVVESGDLEKEGIQQDFIAEIKITGARRAETPEAGENTL